MNQKHLSFVCKQKHVLKNGASPHKFEGLYRLFSIEFYWFHSNIELISKGYQPLIQGFRVLS